MKIVCPSCGNNKNFYHLKDGRLKCSICKKYFTLEKKEIHIKKEDLNKVLKLLILDKSTNYILKEIKISKFKLLKIKKIIRQEIEKKYKNTLEIKNSSTCLAKNTFDKCCSIIINPPKNFLKFLEENLKPKRGIREEKIREYIFEYLGRFKKENLTTKKKQEEIFNLIKDKIGFE